MGDLLFHSRSGPLAALMKEAIEMAQQTFPEFANALELDSHRRVHLLKDSGLKVRFDHYGNPNRTEYMFVRDVKLDGPVVHGTLDSIPCFVRGLRLGQDVSFPISRIADWFLVEGGRGKGGYTLDVLVMHMLPKEYEDKSKLPPLSYFTWRHRPMFGL